MARRMKTSSATPVRVCENCGKVFAPPHKSARMCSVECLDARRKNRAPDCGTEQTRAKLQAPPWENWPSELKAAAIEIDLAVRILAGASLCQAQDMGHVAHVAAGDASAYETALLRRYTWWRWRVVRRGWIVGRIVAVIVGAEHPDTLRRYIGSSTWITGESTLQEALGMWDRA